MGSGSFVLSWVVARQAKTYTVDPPIIRINDMKISMITTCIVSAVHNGPNKVVFTNWAQRPQQNSVS